MSPALDVLAGFLLFALVVAFLGVVLGLGPRVLAALRDASSSPRESSSGSGWPRPSARLLPADAFSLEAVRERLLRVERKAVALRREDPGTAAPGRPRAVPAGGRAILPPLSRPEGPQGGVGGPRRPFPLTVVPSPPSASSHEPATGPVPRGRSRRRWRVTAPVPAGEAG